VDPTEDPAATLERLRLRADIQNALEELPPAQREAFVMHYVEEVPYETMADLSGVSVSALKMRVLRARESLGAALSGGHVTDRPPIRLVSRRG
jgi:RNA polymerase sigma-70 factor (ECF subfamily)